MVCEAVSLGGKIPIAESDSDREKSYSGVSWSDVVEPVLSSLNGRSHLEMSIGSRMCIQAYNEILNRILDANVGKSGFMSLVNGFTKLICRENNPNKETLIDIAYISWSH